MDVFVHFLKGHCHPRAPLLEYLPSFNKFAKTHAPPVFSRKGKECVWNLLGSYLKMWLKFKPTDQHLLGFPMEGLRWDQETCSLGDPDGPFSSPCPPRPAYLRGDGGEAAAEVHVLVHLAAVGPQEPGSEGPVFASLLAAVALVGQEPGQVPVVRRRGPDQRDEDGFRGHVELEEQTHKTMCAGNTIRKLADLARPVSGFCVFMSYRNWTYQKQRRKM